MADADPARRSPREVVRSDAVARARRRAQERLLAPPVVSQGPYYEKVSYVSHLHHGALSDWCEERLTGSAEIAHSIAEQVRGAFITRPPGHVDRHHWSQAERTFAYRVAAMVQPAPPYSALLGLVRAGLVSMSWAHQQAALYPTYANLPSNERERALDFRPTLRGWVDLLPAYDQGAAAPLGGWDQEYRQATRPGFPDESALAELFDRMRSYFSAHARFGQIGSLGPETGIIRLCWLLAAFSYSYRNNSIGHPIFRLFQERTPTVAEMHSAADDLAVSDPLALIDRFSACGALDETRRLAGNFRGNGPWGIVSPAIFNHWSDTHLVLNGPAGSTLLDVVATVRVDAGQRTHRRMWNLLASAWLDSTDSLRVRNVGTYFARHGVLLTWPLEDLAHDLVEGHDHHEARAEFVELAHRLDKQDRARRLEWRASQATTPPRITS